MNDDPHSASPRAEAPFGWLARRQPPAASVAVARPPNPALHSRLLADRAASNRLTAAYPPVLQFLQQAWARQPAPAVLSVLDIGCGQGDLLRAIWRAAWRARRTVLLRGLDIDPDSAREARGCTPPAMGIEYLTGDLFSFDPGLTDIIVCSQLAHTFEDERIVALLQWLDRHARLGWCIADLRRHWLPWLGWQGLARAAGWHRLVRSAGIGAVAGACTEDEWQALLRRAGVHAQIRSHAPFRLTVQRLR